MNYTIYLAAAGVMGLLIVLVVQSISWLQKTLVRNIRSKTMDLLNVYDELLEEKSKQLAAMEQEQPPAAPVQAPPAETADREDSDTIQILTQAIVSSAQRSSQAPYREGAVAGFYQTIRSNFSFDMEQVLPVLETAAPEKRGVATCLMEKLEFDTVYQLSILTPADQQAVLESVLEEREKKFLEDYTRSAGGFRILDFYDYTMRVAAEEPAPARLRVSQELARQYSGNEKVQIIGDADICEGYQVEQDNCLYDFSIKTRELS